ncbi:N-acetylmuramic acid 6-phosphate etherase [Leifsonia sp. AG29]|uniref:N-acetylmuramic acid 6-phosphate etherase n=1 Tax=Leifsonia sp. AG29 TaxID=2598860 RepID=UPI00131C3270|nr:N-acetylmuramic acid 6-phosphate etherase [Leifsonia sp. AG29]
MAQNSPDAELDELMTEAVADGDLMLDELSVAELVTLMNDRDAMLPGAVRDALPTIVAAVEGASERVKAGGRIIYVGAGTSGRLGVLDASEVPPTFGTDGNVVLGLIAGGPNALVSSIEAAEDSEETGRTDLLRVDPGPLDTVVGIASSGRTPYVLGALKLGRERGALTVGLSCNLDTPVSAAADHGIELAVGPEILTGSTRLGAGTATKMVLNMISTITMIRLGKTYKTLMVDVKATNSKLVRRAVRIVTLATGADDETARVALDAADWNAKLAIATIVTGMSVGDAQKALDAAGGVLRTVVATRARAETI